MEILKIHDTSNSQNLDTYSSCSFPSFIRPKYFPSKHITFCIQYNESSSSHFYAEFRNFLPLLVQSSLKEHELPQLSSLSNILVPALFPGTPLSLQVKTGLVMFFSSICWYNSASVSFIFSHFLHKLCHFYLICLSCRK